MRNRWGVEIKRGYYVFAHHPRGGMIEGRVLAIDRESGRGVVLTLDSGATVSADDVSQVMPPMRVLKDGTVKANPDSIHIDIDSHNTKGRNVRAKNPINEARELFLYALNNWDAMQRINALGAATPARAWLNVAQTAARQYSSEHGNGASKWKEIFTEADVQVVAAMLREHFEELRANPLQRVKINSPSQLTGEPPSARLKKRRRKTATMPIPGIWANPLSRVSINSPSQRARKTATGGKTKRPSKRLTDRREYTNAMPAGFYANPVEVAQNLGLEIRVEVKKYGVDRWIIQSRFADANEAKRYARALHKRYPDWAIRVVS